MSIVVSYALLGGTGAYCFYKTHSTESILPTISFGLIAANGIVNVLHIVDRNRSHKKYFKIGSELLMHLQMAFAFPCFVGHLWLEEEYLVLGAIHPVCSLIPFIASFTKSYNIMHRVLAANVISSICVSMMTQNLKAICTTLMFPVAFGLANGYNKPAIEREKQKDIYVDDVGANVCMALYTLMSLHALRYIY